jgi:ribosome maturation factor RimP
VHELLAPVVAAVGLEVEDVELRTIGRRLVVRVLVDSDHGVTLDEVAAASQAVSEALDGSPALGEEPYTLEVSSPGVDRPLTEPRHWRRNVGRLVAVTPHQAPAFTARLVEAGDTTAVLETNTKGRIARQEIAYADVARAVVQVEFSRIEDAVLEPLGGEEAGALDADAAGDGEEG